jgi:multidrug transporter EmrE-like cation transporter
MSKYLLTLIYILFTTCGITFMKLGGDSLKLSLSKEFSLRMGWTTLLGFLFYIVSFLLWQKLLVKYDLSSMVPIVTGISQIIIIIIGYVIFKENVNIQNIIGAITIIVGIIIMTFGKK